ncbi:MAG: nucleotidyltransferase family protein [Actinomycetota bacterium]
MRYRTRGHVERDEHYTPTQLEVLRFELPGWQQRTVPLGTRLATEEMTALRLWARKERLAGLAEAALTGGAGVAECPESYVTAVEFAAQADASAAWAHQTLATAGVDSLVIKGIPAALLDYALSGWRSTLDVDLLVRRSEFSDAIEVLQRAGCQRRQAPFDVDWEQRFGRSVTMYAPSGIEIDVHAMISEGYFGTRQSHEIFFDEAMPLQIGRVRCTTMRPAHRLLTACHAAALSRGPRARYLRDIAELVRRPDSEWVETVNDAGDCAVVAAGLSAASPLLPSEHPASRWARTTMYGRRAQAALALADYAGRYGWSMHAASRLMEMKAAAVPAFLSPLVRRSART